MKWRRLATAVPFIAWASLLAAIFVVLLLSAGGLAGAAASPQTMKVGQVVRLSWNSFYVSALAAILAIAWSILPAVVAAHIERGIPRAVLVGIAILPIFVAPAVLSVVAVRLFGGQGFLTNLILHLWPTDLENELRFAPVYTLTGTGVTLAVAFCPVVFLGGVAALLKAGKSVREAAMLDTTPARALIQGVLPVSKAGFVAAASLTFLLAITEFSVPEALRVQPVLVSDVYARFGVNYDGRAAAVSSLVLILLAVGSLQIVLHLMKQNPGETQLLAEDESGSGQQVKGVTALRLSGWVVALLPAMAIISVLVYTLKGPNGYLDVITRVWELSRQEFFFSLSIALITALITSVAGLILGSLLSTLRRPLFARMLLLIGFVIPGPVTGMALKIMLLLPPGSLPLGIDDWLAQLDSTLVPLLLSYAIRFTPLAALLCEYQLRRVPREWVDATHLESTGLRASIRTWGWWTTWPAVAASALVVFALAMGEVGATVILIPPGPTTLSVRLMTLMHYAPTSEVSALCLLICLPAFAVFPVLLALSRFLSLGRQLRNE